MIVMLCDVRWFVFFHHPKEAVFSSSQFEDYTQEDSIWKQKPRSLRDKQVTNICVCPVRLENFMSSA